MRWILYTVLALTYAITLVARLERAEWMPKSTAMGHAALCLPLAGLAPRIFLGLRRESQMGSYFLLGLAIASAFGCLLLALIPSIP